MKRPPSLSSHFFNPVEIELSLDLFWNRYRMQRERPAPYGESPPGPTVHEFAATFPQYKKLLFAAIRSGEYAPEPAREVRAVLDKPRTLYKFQVPDKFILFHFARLVERLLEPTLSDSVHGFRKGRGVDTALRVARRGVQRYSAHGCFLLRRDIANFGESLDHEVVRREFSSQVDSSPEMVSLLSAFSRYRFVSGAIEREADVGLPNGTHLQLLCENLLLRSVDLAVSHYPVEYVRYGDDLLVVAESSEVARNVAEVITRTLHETRLAARDSKSVDLHLLKPHQCTATHSHCSFRPVSVFTYLGYAMDYRGVVTLPGEKSHLLRRILRARLEGAIALSGHMEIQPRIELLGAVLKSALLSTNDRELSRVRGMLGRVTEERELQNLDHWVLSLVLQLAMGRGFKKGHFRRFSPQMLRRLGVPSILDLRRRHEL